MSNYTRSKWGRAYDQYKVLQAAKAKQNENLSKEGKKLLETFYFLASNPSPVEYRCRELSEQQQETHHPASLFDICKLTIVNLISDDENEDEIFETLPLPKCLREDLCMYGIRSKFDMYEKTDSEEMGRMLECMHEDHNIVYISM